jgi:hypothetical protein
MNRIKPSQIILSSFVFIFALGFYTCGKISTAEEDLIKELKNKGLVAEIISAENFFKGVAPKNFEKVAKAAYKPSFNEEPEIPAQCWIETSYGTQNACKYCHTDYLADISHGNAFPIADDQITYSFPSKNLNRILWQNIIYPQNIEDRLKADNVNIPNKDDVDYVRHDNWLTAFTKARSNGNNNWLNKKSKEKNFKLFPALNPNHLFPYSDVNPTNNGEHGYVDNEGFVRCENNQITGWRAINFFPYAIFTPLTGSVSGVYIRLPQEFMSKNKEISVEVYKQNLDLLEKNIKNQTINTSNYVGDASEVAIKKGFYPVGTEFAHPLHYVDLLADGQVGTNLDGVITNGTKQFEFPGTRSKRVKEIRYMYKWKEVNLEDIAIDEDEEVDESNPFGTYVGKEGEGWIDNGAGWIIAAYIENRHGELRPQTTEELAQCLGCHAKVGNTVDAIWSFQRKLPELEGWAEMNYGHYNSQKPTETKLQDYIYKSSGMGELGYFYYTVVGADLYGVMPAEIREELMNYSKRFNLLKDLGIDLAVSEILDDEILKKMDKSQRKPRLLARQQLMRHYSKNKEYLVYNDNDDKYYVKGNIFYPTQETMKANILGYWKIVLDQSYNLGKDAFGSEADHIPFTFRSDGYVLDENERIIPVGDVIYSRLSNDEGVGITPTGIIEGDAYDLEGNLLKSYSLEDRKLGRITFSGTLDMHYNPILSGISVRK